MQCVFIICGPIRCLIKNYQLFLISPKGYSESTKMLEFSHSALKPSYMHTYLSFRSFINVISNNMVSKAKRDQIVALKTAGISTAT